MGRNITTIQSTMVTSVPPIGTFSDVFTEGTEYSLTKKALSKTAYPLLAQKFPNNIKSELTANVTGFGTTSVYLGMAYGNGIYVSLTATSTGQASVRVSTDLISWSSPVSVAVSSFVLDPYILFGNGKFAICNGSGTSNQLAYSSDGVNWTTTTISGMPNAQFSLNFANGFFFALVSGQAGTTLYKSTNLTTWTTNTIPSISASAISFINNLYVLSIYGSTNYYTSPDLTTWTSRSIAGATTVGYLKSFVINGILFIPTSDGKINSSTDGITWTSTLVLSGSLAKNILFTGAFYIAIFPTYGVSFSSDLATWSAPFDVGLGTLFSNGYYINGLVYLLASATTSLYQLWVSNGALDSNIYLNGLAGKYVRIV